MPSTDSVRFFDRQFRRQVEAGDFLLNPFETSALPHLRGRVLDFGCGLGNLAVAAARQGCEVVALDASPAAIAHLRDVAARETLPIVAIEADLRDYAIGGAFDAAVYIGLLMFFDCATADRQLAALQACVRPGGVAVVNVLVEGTTFLDMFDAAAGHCLWPAAAVLGRFRGWERHDVAEQEFPAPSGTCKRFVTIVARKPAGGGRGAVPAGG
jgi:tellurite methyltransferase